MSDAALIFYVAGPALFLQDTLFPETVVFPSLRRASPLLLLRGFRPRLTQLVKCRLCLAAFDGIANPPFDAFSLERGEMDTAHVFLLTFDIVRDIAAATRVSRMGAIPSVLQSRLIAVS